MSDKEAFIRTIIESPDEDTPRLVYADWLDEHDEPARAEFIRVQCSLAQLPNDAPTRPELQERESELLAEYGWVWAEELGPLVSEWVYQRGFVERVQIDLETSHEEILAVLNKAPIRHLRDTGQFCELDGVVQALPYLDRLTGLEFWGLYAFENELLGQILESPHLANLRTLILHHDRNGNIANEEVIVAAMNSPHRANLEDLAVSVDGMWRGPSLKELNAIATSPYLKKLRKLKLSHAGDEGNNPQMDLDTARVLGSSANMTNLQELDLGQTSFPIEVWDEVLKWPWLPRLQWLRLHYARQINTGSPYTIAELRDLPTYRAAFERLGPEIDWDTMFITPWDGNSCWRGLSWAGLRQQHLFSMWPYVQRQDYEGLEAAFRADCCKYRGEDAAAMIDALPFHRYQEQLRVGLEQAIAAAEGVDGATSIYLRLRPDLQWNGEYHISNEAVPEPFSPYESFSYSGPLAEFDAGLFPEAATVRDQYLAQSPLDPGGASHYLLARTVAAFGRCVARHRPELPVLFDCMYAVFRM